MSIGFRTILDSCVHFFFVFFYFLIFDKGGDVIGILLILTRIKLFNVGGALQLFRLK